MTAASKIFMTGCILLRFDVGGEGKSGSELW